MGRPRVLVLGGPNGAGKTTVARSLVHEELGIARFVNADWIAQGLAAFAPEAAAVAAGRLLLQQVREFAAAGVDFGFETTLASRTFAPWLARLQRRGYEVLVAFLWLPTPEFALRRVAGRVAAGGHAVPPETVRRRHQRGLANFLRLYRPLADRWWCYDGRGLAPRLVACGAGGTVAVVEPTIWNSIHR